LARGLGPFCLFVQEPEISSPNTHAQEAKYLKKQETFFKSIKMNTTTKLGLPRYIVFTAAYTNTLNAQRPLHIKNRCRQTINAEHRSQETVHQPTGDL
jgi:hypothetical protein